MKHTSKIIRFFLILTLSVLSATSQGGQLKALIVTETSENSTHTNVRTELTSRLTEKGFAVTSNSNVLLATLSDYQQVWDLRIGLGNPADAIITTNEKSAYLNYLKGGGSLFLMGENSTSFATRNQSINEFIQLTGGDSLTITSSESNLQTVQSPFTGPSEVSTVTYLVAGGFTGLSKGRFITKASVNSGSGIVYSPGTMTNAMAGTLISILDINFLQSTASAALKNLVGNLISYLAAPAPANAAPTASNVAINGTPQVSASLNGTYAYADTENDPQGATTFRWVRNSVNTGVGGGSTVASAQTYTVAAADAGSFLYFCVTPIASAGTATGAEVCSAATSAVVAGSQNGVCGTAANAASATAPTVNLCSTGSAGQVLVAGTSWSWSCSGNSGGTTASCTAPFANTNAGNAIVGAIQASNTQGWQINTAASGFVALPAPAPAGVTLPGGATKVVLNTGTPGTSTTVTLRFSSIPAGAVMYKYGKENATDAANKWFPYPATIDQAAGTVTYTLTDGQKGDNDWTVNGVIDDPVALGAPVAAAAVEGVPTLSEWAMALLAGLMGLATLLTLRRRAG